MNLSTNKKTLLSIFLLGFANSFFLNMYEGDVYREIGLRIFSSIGAGVGVMLISWIFLRWKGAKAAWICSAISMALMWLDVLNS